MLPARWSLRARLKDFCPRTGRAWAFKEEASRRWDYVSVNWAWKASLTWAALAARGELEPMARAARIVRKHLEGILNAVALTATNAAAESMNARSHRVKAIACGCRIRERFHNVILFHLEGLNPTTRTASAHTIS
jgi:transposase